MTSSLSSTEPQLAWAWDNTWARDLSWLSVDAEPVPVTGARLLAVNAPLARELGIDPDDLRRPRGLAVVAGNEVAIGSQPLSQAYAGHQFGSFNPLLGDGRAHVLGEVIDTKGRRRDIALKGSGRTPFSRGGDGRAAVGPVLREFLVSESMHALGIATTRALAAVATGEPVLRQTPLPGAVLTRVASSHLRIGSAELVSSRRPDHLVDFVEYVRARHYPEVAVGDALGVLSGVVARQAELVAAWMSVGFVHGVMNTDNMTLSGETIDFGPCAFLDTYDPQAWFSSIDSHGRYRYSAQPHIALWNLARLAEALLPTLDDDPDRAITLATERVQEFGELYQKAWLDRFSSKLGLPGVESRDARLIEDYLSLVAVHKHDFTSSFRELANLLRVRVAGGRLPHQSADFDAWLQRWFHRLDVGDVVEPAATSAGGHRANSLADEMDLHNPLYIPRNELVEEALAAAPEDLEPFERLLEVVRTPYAARDGYERYARPADADFQESYRTFCGT